MLWGIDLGGTKIEGAILPNRNSTAPILRRRIATEAEGGYEHIVSRLQELVQQMAQESGQRIPDRLGIGTPGAVEPSTGLMKNCNTTELNGKPLLSDLESVLGRKVTIANDANCFALAEATLGSARGYPTVFGVIMGTGVGGGFVADGKVLHGLQGIAGEWGHMSIRPEGPPCYSGIPGCVESHISGPACERYYESRSGTKRRLADIVKRAETGDDPDAEATLEHLCKWFGRSLANVVNVLDPHAIVLGGGVGNVAALYTRGREQLGRFVFNSELKTPLLKPALGDSAGVFGAALLTQDLEPRDL
jgi:predicted NBD/HSP70 family sugar kinase